MLKKKWERSEAFAWEVLEHAPYGVLALADEMGAPYCIPVSPAVDHGHIYLHCARIGLKMEILKKNPKAALTAVSYYKAVSEKYTMSYASAVARGTMHIVEDDEERVHALRCISERYSRQDLDKFDAMMEQYEKAVHVLRMDVEELTGKEALNG